MAKRTKPQTELGVYTRIFVAENHDYFGSKIDSAYTPI
jgi:hypothetical protein